MLDSSTSLVCREDMDRYLQELLGNDSDVTGIFKSFSAIVARSGGSFLVGKAGDKHFFITGWLDSE